MHHRSFHEMHCVLGSVSGLYHHGFRGTINFCDKAFDRGGLFGCAEDASETKK
jgi:hypothetical protein